MKISPSIIVLFLSTVTSCSLEYTEHYPDKQIVKKIDRNQEVSNISFSMPEGWTQVEDPAQLKAHVIWSISLQNDYVTTDHPTFLAWDAPEELNAFLTCMKVKRERSVGIGFWYDQITQLMRDSNAQIQETGTSKVGGNHCKWWIQTLAGGALQQKCYLVGHNNYIYFFYFTARFLSPDCLESFDSIVDSVSFNK